MKITLKDVLSVLIFASGLLVISRSTPMEDLMETEIDSREPKSFKLKNMLSVRINGFKYLTHKEESSDVIYIPNWEVFAHK
jgi:hypothetical protein